MDTPSSIEGIQALEILLVLDSDYLSLSEIVCECACCVCVCR